jgi:hypothetical protein
MRRKALNGFPRFSSSASTAARCSRLRAVSGWAAIPGQLVALARRLGLPEQAEQAETVHVLWDALRHRDRWLLVFDNAEHPTDLRPWWPPSSGRVLVTSRNPTWTGLAATVPVDVLPRAEAVAFLQHRLGREGPALDQLAHTLGELPLALEQAAAYLEETASSPHEYLGLLGTHAHALFGLGQPATTAQTIATTWTISLQQLRQHAPAAEDLLVLLAFLAADDLPRALPAEHAARLPERLAATVADPLAYQQTIAALRRYSLVKTSADSMSVHRLVQAVVRQQLDPNQQQHWASAALHLVRAAFPTKPLDPAAWPAYARLLPHALAVTGHATTLGVDPETTAWLLAEAGAYVFERGDYPQAHRLHERALPMREARLGPDHPDTADSLRYLAFVHYAHAAYNHGQVRPRPGQGVEKWHNRYSANPDNLGNTNPTRLLAGVQQILAGCALVLRPGGLVVLTTRPWRFHGARVDLPGQVAAAAERAGLAPLERNVALLAELREQRLVGRASFFQIDNTRKSRATGLPVHVVAHEDVLVFRQPTSPPARQHG